MGGGFPPFLHITTWAYLIYSFTSIYSLVGLIPCTNAHECVYAMWFVKRSTKVNKDSRVIIVKIPCVISQRVKIDNCQMIGP